MGPKWGEDQKMSDQPKDQENEGGGLEEVIRRDSAKISGIKVS